MENNEWVWTGDIEVNDEYFETTNTYTLLTPGKYEFTFLGFDQIMANDADYTYKKFGTKGLEVKIRIEDPESHKDVYVRDTLWFTNDQRDIKRLVSFLGSIGFVRKGTKNFRFTPENLSSFIGATGECEIYNRKGKNTDTVYNNVKFYYYKENGASDGNNWGAWNG